MQEHSSQKKGKMLHFFKNHNSHWKIPVVSSDFYETVGFSSLILEKTVARYVSTSCCINSKVHAWTGTFLAKPPLNPYPTKSKPSNNSEYSLCALVTLLPCAKLQSSPGDLPTVSLLYLSHKYFSVSVHTNMIHKKHTLGQWFRSLFPYSYG